MVSLKKNIYPVRVTLKAAEPQQRSRCSENCAACRERSRELEAKWERELVRKNDKDDRSERLIAEQRKGEINEKKAKESNDVLLRLALLPFSLLSFVLSLFLFLLSPLSLIIHLPPSCSWLSNIPDLPFIRKQKRERQVFESAWVPQQFEAYLLFLFLLPFLFVPLPCSALFPMNAIAIASARTFPRVGRAQSATPSSSRGPTCTQSTRP
jgi:vacuolar-type H+-ATPase subunit H